MRKPFFKIGILAFIVIVQCSCSDSEVANNGKQISSYSDSSNSNNNRLKQVEQTDNVESKSDKEVSVKLSVIPNLSFESLSKKLKSLGFETVEKCYPDLETNVQTCEWNFDLDSHHNHYNVTAFGKTRSSIEQLEILGTYNTVADEETERLFSLIASIDYRNSNSKEAVLWVKKNFAKDSARTTIGGINFKLFSKTPQGTFLTVSIDD